MLNRGYVVATAIAIVLSFSAAVADEAERIESCTAETNAVVQAFLDHALSDAGAELRLQAASESGTLHFLETVWNAGCHLDPLYHDDAQIELVGEAEADDLVRNLGGLHVLAIVDIEYPSAGVAEVDYVLLTRVLHGTVIDKSLGCGGYVYLSKNEEGWTFDLYRPGLCT